MSNENILEKTALNIGFIPLTDCATLAIAKEKGFFEKYGLDVYLSREASWANIRDKLAYGVLDCAQMLATMPITSTLGIGGWKKDTVSSMVLGVNGNAITVSNNLYSELKDRDEGFDKVRPVTADALKAVIDKRKAQGKKPLTFAHVFPASTHNYFLRYWLASSGINPDTDLDLIVIPPPQMVKNLEADMVDGFCVGEPWNQFAVNSGIGHALITSYEIWNNAPEKVLGVNKEWAYNHPNTHKAVVKALIDAARWIDKPENRLETAEIVSRDEYINVPTDIIRGPLTGEYKYDPESKPVNFPDFNVFYKYTATFPWHSHAAWYMSQMIRWQDIPDSLDTRNIINDIFWVDFYREIVSEMGLDFPLANCKSEGTHRGSWSIDTKNGSLEMSSDLFFDDEIFTF
ncbi:MAG: CmpA/NrtA family ABC transporter substrate-binding protein [Gammaproteobacteria bacterium]|jgi:nitrate/nitrite transport system substrate-binding protein